MSTCRVISTTLILLLQATLVPAQARPVAAFSQLERITAPVITHREWSPSDQEADRAAGWRKAAQVAGGIVGAAVVGLTAWTILDDPEGADRRVKGDAGYTPNANTAYAIGSFVGSTIAVYAIGRSDGSRGSVLATAIGASVATIPLFLGRNEPFLPVFGVVLGAPLQAIGGTIGYQRTRERAAR